MLVSLSQHLEAQHAPLKTALCELVRIPSVCAEHPAPSGGNEAKVVTIMNYNSIVDVIPVGGDDLDHAGPCLELRYASGQETFVPLDSPQTSEHPTPGEVIYVVADSGRVMCRRWNWRNGYETRITEETRAMVMNIDGLGEESESRTAKTRDRVAAMLEKYCSARTLTSMLSPAQPSFRFEV